MLSRLIGSTAKAKSVIQSKETSSGKSKNLKNMMLNNRLIILSTMILATLSAEAKDFGVSGHTQKIVEQPFLEMIGERLEKVDIEKEKQKMEQIAKERVNNPIAIAGVTPATQTRLFYFDPTYTLPEDAILPCGKILHRAGTKVNPLGQMSLDRRLFFIDSREKEQVRWLKEQLVVIAVDNQKLQESKESKENKEEDSALIEGRIILVGGSPLKLEEELKHTVYFDQSGVLTSKFGIKHSPALVEQDGLKLRIKELKI